ncbi:hypothetical protein PHSY_000637 [Pseudozyma hubeiensis SY62]|uniref:Uncharacterized protein n=1 Tax=Pseudozyma hubeiensis (strain SY62) TaxID=1305764 RepID=R9NX03_PSEHS|nr:hypothetical protein PHSY_000637 [Pseudozyma hubeiensis SY62]GAC93076.1 hypothetical protein PHSY_000637 [Pseudozyma hubeiensis SY62]
MTWRPRGWGRITRRSGRDPLRSSRTIRIRGEQCGRPSGGCVVIGLCYKSSVGPIFDPSDVVDEPSSRRRWRSYTAVFHRSSCVSQSQRRIVPGGLDIDGSPGLQVEKRYAGHGLVT